MLTSESMLICINLAVTIRTMDTLWEKCHLSIWWEMPFHGYQQKWIGVRASMQNAETALIFLARSISWRDYTGASFGITLNVILMQWAFHAHSHSFHFISYGSPVTFSYSCWSFFSLSSMPFFCTKSLLIYTVISFASFEISKPACCTFPTLRW